MNKNKKTRGGKVNKLFTGGDLSGLGLGSLSNQLGSSGGQALGLGQGFSNSLGGYAQMGTGIATGNPQDILSGSKQLLTQGVTNASNIFKDPNATFKDKLLGAYGVISPFASQGVSDRLTEMKNADTEFSNDMKQRNKLFGLADGGGLSMMSPRTPYVTETAIPPLYSRPFQGIPEMPMLPTLAPIQQLPQDRINELNDAYKRSLYERGEDYQLEQYNDIANQIRDNSPSEFQRVLLPPTQGGGGRGVPARGQRTNLSPEVMKYLQSGQKADGGTLLNSLNYINGGYSHNDTNPNNMYEGTPLAVNGEGMDVAQKGEVVIKPSQQLNLANSYVGSNEPEFKITKEDAKKYGLGKHSIGKTPAQALKNIQNTLKDYSYDRIAETSAKETIQGVIAFNEAKIAEKELNNYKKDLDIVSNDLLEDGGWIKGAIKKPGSFTAQAKAKGISPAEFQAKVLANPDNYNSTTVRRANLRKTLVSMHDKGGPFKTQTPLMTPTQDPYNRESLQYPLIFPNVESMPPFGQAQPTNQGGKRWSIQDELKYAETPEDKLAALQNFSRRAPSEWGYYAQQAGQQIGSNGVPMQDIQGRFAGGVSSEHLAMLYPNIAKQVSPTGDLNWSDAQIDQFQKLYNEANYDKMMELDPNNPTYSRIGGDWLRGRDLPGRQNETPLQSKPYQIPNNFDSGLMPFSKTQKPDRYEFPEPPSELPNFWPEVAAATPFMFNYDPNLVNPVTMNVGHLRPELVNEMSMRSGIDTANRANTGSLAGVTGGSASAQRASMLGAGSNYMDAINNAFLQANQANNAAKMGAQQFNIGTQADVAARNMGVLNEADARNAAAKNQFRMEELDTKIGALQDYAMAGQDRRLSRDNRNAMINATGYDPNTALYRTTKVLPWWQQTYENVTNKPEAKKACNGGSIRRGLK